MIDPTISLILSLVIAGALILTGTFIFDWIESYHGEKYCPTCGCPIEIEWYAVRTNYDTTTGEGIQKQVRQAACPIAVVPSHFSRRVKGYRFVAIDPACGNKPERY